MGTAARGNAAEASVLNGLIRLGFDVYVPFGSGHPLTWRSTSPVRDFSGFKCKRAWPQKGCLVFNSHSTDHGRGERSYIGLADLFGVYYPARDEVFLVPVESVAPFEGRLRLEPPRNNQRKRIRFAADFAIGRWTEEKLRALSA
jgi:hypothetical protein